MNDFDFHRTFDRVGIIVAGITTVTLAGTLTVDQYHSHHPLRHWVYVVMMCLAAAIAVGYVAQWAIGQRQGVAGRLRLLRIGGRHEPWKRVARLVTDRFDDHAWTPLADFEAQLHAIRPWVPYTGHWTFDDLDEGIR